jgi:hypothetical protein
MVPIAHPTLKSSTLEAEAEKLIQNLVKFFHEKET